MFENLVIILLAIFLSLVHLIVVYFSHLEERKQSIISSIGGGISLSYVFLHLMPELAVSGNKIAHNFLGDLKINLEIVEVSFFLVVLIGLLLLFVVDVLTEEAALPKKFNFGIHLLYNTTISYIYAFSLHEVVRGGSIYAFIYTLTLSTHIFAGDRLILEFHQDFYRKKFKWVSFSAVLLGLINSFQFPTISTFGLELTFAFLSGGVLLNTFLEELPKKSLINLRWFLSAVVLTSTLIFLSLFHKII